VGKSGVSVVNADAHSSCSRTHNLLREMYQMRARL